MRSMHNFNMIELAGWVYYFESLRVYLSNSAAVIRNPHYAVILYVEVDDFSVMRSRNNNWGARRGISLPPLQKGARRGRGSSSYLNIDTEVFVKGVRSLLIWRLEEGKGHCRPNTAANSASRCKNKDKSFKLINSMPHIQLNVSFNLPNFLTTNYCYYVQKHEIIYIKKN